MRRHSSCPVGHTCPDIDDIIKTLEGLEERLGKIGKLPLCEIEGEADDIAYDLNNIYSGRNAVLEKLRSANEELRKWGEGLESRVDELEQGLAAN